MMQQARDFQDESDALWALVSPLTDADLARPTAFKQWSIATILRHLHVWNRAADMALTDPEGFPDFYKGVAEHSRAGTLPVFEREWLGALDGTALVSAWRAFYPAMAARFGAADPKARVAWAGPSMSVRSSITARLMETWAHGQAIYDLLGIERVNTDRIRNIAVLGVNTFGWTFRNRDLPVPEPMPRLHLTAPSGEVWTWGEATTADRIEGPAEAFCQVVTQTRNVADTALVATGPDASAWMTYAQCFAGPPNDPPAPGTRCLQPPPRA